MPDFDFSTLITDRSASDLELLRDLLSTPMGDWTAEQLAAFNQAISKGAYNYTDLNRVTACMDYLDETLRAYGYETGYQRIVVHPEEPPGPVGPLPEGYTELEYIQSSGNQYIVTNLLPNGNTGVKIKFQTSYNTASHSGAIIGSDMGWGNNGFAIYGHIIEYGSQNFSYSFSGEYAVDVYLNKNVLSVGESIVWTGTKQDFSSVQPFLIFGNNRNGNNQELFTGKLYSLEIYSNDVLKCKFYPCKNQSGEIGLYDIVDDQFYGNAGGGAFTAGPEVPQPEPEPTLDPYTWYEADVPTVSTMEAYLGNVSALRSVLTLPEGTAQAPGDMAGLTPTEANRIEEILSVIGAYLEAMITVFRRCGAAICGGPGFYFLN